MYGEQHPALVALREARETIIEQLSDGFAQDKLSLEDFEQRVDKAYTASSREEIQALVRKPGASSDAAGWFAGPEGHRQIDFWQCRSLNLASEDPAPPTCGKMT